MPARRKRDADEVEDDADELKPTEGELAEPSNKKSRASTQKTEVEGAGEVHENDAGEKYIKLSEYRRLTVRKWKDMVLVDIREFYKDKKDGQVKPGSKGISLTLEQWSALKQGSDVIDNLLDEIK